MFRRKIKLPIGSLLVFIFSTKLAFATTIVQVKELPADLPKINPANFSGPVISLGEKLFYDPNLSSSKSRACSTCHIPSNSFASGADVDPGDSELGTRNTPVLINRYFSDRQMWDGRAESLQEQVWMPILGKSEMNNTPDAVLSYINASPEYSKLFRQAFGEGPSEKNVAHALVQFVSANFATDSRYDEFVRGKRNALNAAEKRGMVLFQDKFKCVSCHSGHNFTNEQIVERCGRDQQEYKIDDSYVRKYKVPTLRNLTESAPYFHNGKLPTIASVLEFYQGCQVIDEAGKKMSGQLVQMTAKEKNDLEKFLRSLSSKIYQYRPEK